MVRKMLSVLGIAFISLLAMGGVSSAAPAPVVYPAPPTVIVNVNINIIFIVNGGTVIFFGSGFDPLEGLDITVTYGPPSGLRSTPALAEAAAAKRLTTQADSAGNFSTPVNLTQVGTATLTATGQTSGKSASITVEVFQNESDYTGVVTGGSSSGTWTGTSGGSSSGALASTGASVAGPIAIGAAALFAGLAMLFFGTRGVIRRKSSRSAGGI